MGRENKFHLRMIAEYETTAALKDLQILEIPTTKKNEWSCHLANKQILKQYMENHNKQQITGYKKDNSITIHQENNHKYTRFLRLCVGLEC